MIFVIICFAFLTGLFSGMIVISRYYDKRIRAANWGQNPYVD